MSEDRAWLVPFCFLGTFWAMSAAICTDDLLSKHISRSCFLNAKLFPSHTSLPHAVLSHTTFLHAPHLPQLSRTTLSHTTLSHMSHSHTTLYNNQSSPISFVFPAFSVPLQPLFVTCGVIRSFNFCCFCRSCRHIGLWPMASQRGSEDQVWSLYQNYPELMQALGRSNISRGRLDGDMRCLGSHRESSLHATKVAFASGFPLVGS